MKHVLLGLVVGAASLSATAQSFHCDTDRRRAEMIAADPTYLEREAAYAEEIRAMIRDNARINRDGDLVVTLPIVFHVLHLGGSENITDEQIFNQVAILNEDYRALNASAATVHPAFRDLVGDAKIQFELPTKDPHGNCTNGINRIKSPETFRGEQESKKGSWGRDKYINVWVTRAIISGAAGYANYPGAWDGPVGRLLDGIMILHDYVGAIGTSNPGRSHALTHEIGHFLNLPHVWGNNNGVEPGGAPEGHMVPDCGDDDVDDTPVTRGWSRCDNANHLTWGWATDCNAIQLVGYAYRFDSVTTASGTTDPTPVVNPSDEFQGATRERAQFSPFTAHGVDANPSRNGVFSFSGWPAEDVNGETNYGSMPNSFDATKYYSFTIDANVTDQLFLDSIGFTLSRNANGIRNFSVRSSVNNFASNLVIRAGGNPNISTHTGNIGFIKSDEAFENLTIYVDPPQDANYIHANGPVTFRFYGWNAETADAVARVCANSAPVDLFKRLGGGPQPGGAWTGPSEMINGLFDPATMEAGTYTYTVEATESCPEYTSTVEVSIIEAPEAPVISGDAGICAGSSTVLTSSVTSDIRWSTGQTTATIQVNSANTYTVSTTAGECTSTSEPFTVTVSNPVSAGTSGPLALCAGDSAVAVALSAGLRGTPAEGGTWTGPSEVIDGMYDPDTMEPGEYVYTVDGVGACPAATATVTVTEVETANAGTNSTASLCNNISTELFQRLSGGPQPGGQWYTPAGVAFDGTFNGVTMTAGVYRYEVDLGGTCGLSSATLTVTRVNAPNVPTIGGNTSFCEGGSVVLQSSSLVNNRWFPGGATTPGFRVSAPGTYTVRVTNPTSGCFSESAPVQVAMASRVNAGGDGQLVTCDEGPGMSLFSSLGGTPNEGGEWSGPSTVTDGLYHPGSMAPGQYRYVVTAVSPCLNDTAYVTVSESGTLAQTPGTFGVDDVRIYGSTSLVENVENYMEYAYCQKMFTLGQVTRMRAALNSTVGERSSLWSDATHRASGVGEYRTECPPQADFYTRTALIGSNQVIPYSTTVCTGEPVQFVDISSGGRVTSWAWTFEGGNPATSTERNPVVTYDTPGFKRATLTVSNEHGSATKEDLYGVHIGGSPHDYSGLYHEGFDDRDHMHPWSYMNYDDNNTSWRLTGNFGHQSNACIMLNSGERNMLDLVDPANGRDYDDLISPSFNLSHMTEGSFSFRYAYSTQADTIPDITERLEVTVSTDCGKTWATMPGGEIREAELVNNGNDPQQPPQAWTQKVMPLSAARRVANVRFRFRFISSQYSNNLYIDDINISGVVGVEELSPANFMNLYPNPTNDRFTLGVHGMDQHETTITITDLRGAVVHQNILAPTSRPLDFSATELGLADGLYLINASNAEGRHTQKLLVGR